MAKISGLTDLPDGASITAAVSLAGNSPEAIYIGSEAEVVVHSGRWEVNIPFPEASAFAKGPHEATALFTPRVQSREVQKLVGSNGEKLRGSLVERGNEFGVMKTSKRVKLTFSKQRAPMPKPDLYSQGDPRRAVANMLVEWKNKDLNLIARNGTLSRPSTLAERREWVEDNISFRTLETATITSVDQPGLLARVNVDIRYSLGGEVKQSTIGFVVLKVNRDAQPSEGGIWRVNLAAVARGGF